MSSFRRMFLLAGLVLSIVVSFRCTKEEGKTPAQTITIDNLKVAYARALKHQDMYVRFAAQAQKEKFFNVSRLYRALRRSEEIHAANHAALLQKLGVTPITSSIEPPVVGRTIQTLKLAHSSEAIEIVSMYGEMIRVAQAEQAPEAVQQFTCLQNADARHADLLNTAIVNGGNIPTITYFVCPTCGLIMTDLSKTDCAGCKTPKEKYEKF